MGDLLDFNHGGATHPGARAVVHPGAESGEHVIRYTVVAETEQHVALDDGYLYDKRTGQVRGPDGRPTLQNRVAVTEGSAMYASWSPLARGPRRWQRCGGPGGAVPPSASQHGLKALRHLLRRR